MDPTDNSPSQPTKVVMMVGNDIAHDTRVLKMGLSLADAGLDVTLLGYASSGTREDRSFGPMRILRIPVHWRLRDAARRREQMRRKTSGPVGFEARRTALDSTLSARLREAESGGGPVAPARVGAVRARRFMARAAAALGRRSARGRRLLWGKAYGARNRTTIAARWRRDLPEIDDYELAFGPVLDQLEWEVLHAHDVHLVGVAARAVARRRAQGRPARWVYDAHEYVAGLGLYGSRTPRFRAAYVDLEREYIRSADAVITVSDVLARRLQSAYRLPTLPAVVMNCPVSAPKGHVGDTIRDRIGLSPAARLIVFSGGITPVRSVDTAVRALPQLTGVHMAVVAVPDKEIPAARQLATLASELGVADRFHLLDPVGPSEVSSFLRGADIGIIPTLHLGNHEVALANKLFEYLHAGVALLVSDCEAQSAFVRRHQVGGVFLAGDVDSFAAQAASLLDRIPELRQRITADEELLATYSWEHQGRLERTVYRSLLGEARVPEPVRETPLSEITEITETPRRRPQVAPVVGIAPANSAGQAWAWGKALEAEHHEVRVEVVTVDNGSPLRFPCDELVPSEVFRKDARWAQAFESRALESWTHALLEAGRPAFGTRNGRDFSGDAQVLRAAGIDVALVFHGSEIRSPERHAQRTPWSPFRDPSEDLTARLQSQWERLYPMVEAFEGPKLVSTPDLLVDVPGSIWLPVVVDVDRWATDAPVMERDRPVVLHAPSRASLKGSSHVEDAMTTLEAEGVIRYRRVEGVSPEEIPNTVFGADIVIDQLAIGSYGVFAAEAMAAGRVVVGHIMDDVRALPPSRLPIVEATGDTLSTVIRSLVEDREASVEAALTGRRYVNEVHSGSLSAQVLTAALGLETAPSSLST